MPLIDPAFFSIALIAWSSLAGLVFVMLFFIPVPYGKIERRGWGKRLDSTKAWLIMESVSWAGMLSLFLTGFNKGLPYLIFFLLWFGHYTYRALLFPFLRRKHTSTMPIVVMLSAVGFNSANAFFNGYSLFHLGRLFDAAWLADPRFVIGVLLFAGGFIMNVSSDRILRNLRRPGEQAYKVPVGGFFRFVSCPNYLGEIMEWIGWAVLTWSWAGAAFALWTIANLAPRALSYHAWYKKTFPEYPTKRKALIPFIL